MFDDFFDVDDIVNGHIDDVITVPVEVFEDNEVYTSTDSKWGKEYRDDEFDVLLMDADEFEEELSECLCEYDYKETLPEGKYNLIVSFRIDYEYAASDIYFGRDPEDMYTGDVACKYEITIKDVKIA